MFFEIDAVPYCPICFELYTTRAKSAHLPKVLSCGHTICAQCCSSLIAVKNSFREIRLLLLTIRIISKEKRPKKISCPMCRKACSVNSTGEFFGTNFALAEMIDHLQSE
jgi:hypothetical protein